YSSYEILTVQKTAVSILPKPARQLHKICVFSVSMRYHKTLGKFLAENMRIHNLINLAELFRLRLYSGSKLRRSELHKQTMVQLRTRTFYLPRIDSRIFTSGNGTQVTHLWRVTDATSSNSRSDSVNPVFIDSGFTCHFYSRLQFGNIW
ncbi:hypothetical protein CRM22_003248, partial [Opisthorchis felineus]